MGCNRAQVEMRTVSNNLHRILLAAVIILSSLRAYGGIVLNDPEMWSIAGDLEGWTNAPPTNPAPVDTTLSNPSNYLRITFDDQGAGPPSEEDDIIYTAGDDYTGSYQIGQLLGVTFDFLAEDMLPWAAALYLHSTVSTGIWEYSFLDMLTAGSWSDVSIPFDYDAGWIGKPGGQSQFWSDLAYIDWIGVDIARAWDTSLQDYGIDNWEYYIPEPGSTCVLASALISLAFTFRKRLRGKT